MIYVHLFIFAARYALYTAATVVVLFVGYLLTVPMTAGYHDAEQAYQRMPELLEQRQELVQRQTELLAMAQDAAQQAAGHERVLLAEQELHRAAQAAQMDLVQGLDRARAAANEQRESLAARGQQFQNTFGLALVPMPSDPQALELWLSNAQSQMNQVCTAQWGDLSEWSRVRGLVAGNLSQVCSGRRSTFSTLQQAAQVWSGAHTRLASVQGQMETAQESAQETMARIQELAAVSSSAEDAQMEYTAGLGGVEAELVNNQQELQAMESATRSAAGWAAGLRAQYSEYEDWLWVQWAWFWPRALGFLALAWSIPYLARAINFYVVAPLVMRTHPIAFDFSEAELAQAQVHSHPSERTLQVVLKAGEGVCVRPDHVRQVQSGRSRTRWLLDSDTFGQSWLFGFFGLTEVRQPAGEEDTTRVTIAATNRDAADTYVMRVDLVEHPGFVIQPAHVVALSDGLVLGSQWRWGLHAWMRLQFRYIMVRGSGSIWLEGYGDVFAEEVGSRESHQDSAAYVAWDGRLRLRLRRRETAWPYVLGQMELFETGMSGDGAFVWQKSAQPTGRTGLERTVGAFWSVLGKFLGF
jgi:uncharacterized protein (AIM24 family)